MGTVTSPTGTVKGIPLTGLTDGGCYGFGGLINSVPPSTPAQWQFLGPLMSSVSGVCSRLSGGGNYHAGEITLRFDLFGYADYPGNAPVYPPAADLPLTFTANQLLTTSDGVHRMCNPYVMKAGNNGHAGNDIAATGGTVTYTRIDATGVAGSWDLMFNGDHTTGGFDCAWCGTPP
jgi:hypothetical protein